MCLCESVTSVGLMHCYKQFMGAARKGCIILSSMYLSNLFVMGIELLVNKTITLHCLLCLTCLFPQRDSFVVMC